MNQRIKLPRVDDDALPTLDLDVGALDPFVLLTPAVTAAVPACAAVDCGSDSGTGCSVGVRIAAGAVEAADEAAAAGKGATAAVVAVVVATVVLPPGPRGGTALAGPTDGPEDMSRPTLRRGPSLPRPRMGRWGFSHRLSGRGM